MKDARLTGHEAAKPGRARLLDHSAGRWNVASCEGMLGSYALSSTLRISALPADPNALDKLTTT
jgi:hypothetical protein